MAGENNVSDGEVAGIGLPEDFVQSLMEGSDGEAAGAAAAQAEAAPTEVPEQTATSDELPAQDVVPESQDPKEETDPEDIEARAEKATQSPGLQKRFKQLTDQRNEYREQLAKAERAFQNQISQLQAQLAHQNEQNVQHARQQNSMLQKQLEMLTQRATNEQLDKMSPLERHDHDLKQKVSKELEDRIYQALAPLQGKLDAAERRARELEHKAEQQRRFNHYNDVTKKASKEVLLKDVDPTLLEQLGPDAEETLLAYSAAYGIEPHQAAPKFKKFLDGYARGYMNAKAAQAKAQVAKQQSVPGVARPTAPKSGKPRLTLSEIKKQGYSDFVEYYANNPF